MAASRAALAAALLLAAAPLPLGAQAPPSDSLAALRRARSEQAAFERFRYRHLPRSLGGGSGACTMRVGRWCFWFTPASENRLPEEPEGVARRRGEMTERLGELAAAFPGEPWIAGQVVRYRTEGGDFAGALETARACRAEPWWCRALEGYAHHHAGRFADAERAYAAALAAMDDEERARWADPRVLLSDGDRRALGRLGAEEREAVERRLWWLADPLWADTGNDRRTEHYARWTIARMQDRARQVDGTAWGDDTREVVLRYGWSVAWERRGAPFRAGGTDDAVVGHSAERSWEWLVPLEVARDPQELRPDVWPLEEEAPTLTRYAPTYARRLLPLDVQVAAFRRPGGLALVAGYRVAPDSLPARPALRVHAVAMAGPEGARTASARPGTDTAGVLILEVPAGATVLSVEAREDSARLLWRWRAPVAEPGARVSDLLLLADPEARPETLEDAARLARGTTRLRPGERVAVYWEMYDLPPTDSLTVRLGLVSPRAGWLRRGLQAVGVAGPSRAVRMRVREETGGGAAVGRSLAVALPADLRPGDYTLEVTVQAPGHPPATATRVLTVIR